MKKTLYLDKKKRNLNVKFDNKRFVLKSLYKNVKISKANRLSSISKISDKKYSSSNLVSRCIFTGQKKKINNYFHVSRLSFLKLARNGFISGIKKSTW